MRTVFRRVKHAIGSLVFVDRYIPLHLKTARWLHYHWGPIGRLIAVVMDRWLLIVFGMDVYSYTVNVKALSISHPVGILFGGNGVYSNGRVVVMAGVKFVGRSPIDPEYLRRHAISRVFVLGDNVIIGANSVVLGPIDICDNVMIGAMSLVNSSITEPGVYVGVPARRLEGSSVGEEWVAHLH